MLKNTVLGAIGAIALSATPASAATVIYGAANPAGNIALLPAGPGAVSNALSFDVSGTGAFTAVFKFVNIFNPAAVGGSASFRYDPDVITFTDGFFSGGPNVVVINNGLNGASIQVNRAYLAAGPQTLTFKGTLTRPPRGNSFARIGGQLTLSAAVPEPATWALLILGFGAVGAALRRKTGSVRFATA